MAANQPQPDKRRLVSDFQSEVALQPARDFVELELKRNRGWPWPEDSFGLTPMFGETGWCRSCGIPKREQSGSLTLQTNGMSNADGAWVPYWRYDNFCVSGYLAAEITNRFNVELREVKWRGNRKLGPAVQIVAPSSTEPWFDPAALHEALVVEHGSAGTRCAGCGVWRWMPLLSELLPTPNIVAPQGNPDVIASSEWFGDGLKSFRLIAFNSSLAELIESASPRDFVVRPWAGDDTTPQSDR